MALPQHLDEAAGRLKDAAARIERVRARPATVESLGDWLGALTDFVLALSDIHSFNNESIHEKLHEIADRVGMKEFRMASVKGSS